MDDSLDYAEKIDEVITMILDNLISNALKYTEKGYIRIRAEWVTENGILAAITLNMFPKLELAVILMYLVMLPNVFLPSSILRF